MSEKWKHCTMFSLKISHSQKYALLNIKGHYFLSHRQNTPLHNNYFSLPSKQQNFLLHKILVIQKLPFNETTGDTCMERFCIDITHFNPTFHASNFHTPYLLNRENFLEHIFSLSIEFLYHSVSESSKAINPYIPMKLCSFYTQVQAHSVELSVWPYLWTKQTPLKLPKGWSYTKLTVDVTFLHISHIVLTSSPHEPQLNTDGKYIFWDFLQCFRMVLKHRDTTGRIDYWRSSHCSQFFLSQRFCHTKWNYKQDIANRYTSNTNYIFEFQARVTVLSRL